MSNPLNPISGLPHAAGNATSPERAAAMQAAATAPRILAPHEYVEGLAGMAAGGGGASLPGGAPTSASAFRRPDQRVIVPAPMDRPVMKELRKEAQDWFNTYLVASRGEGLRPNEEVPSLLLLVLVLFNTDKRRRHEALNCMRDITIPLSTSSECTVYWARQPFTAVPYAVQHFPIHVAIHFLEMAKNHVFDDLAPVVTSQGGFPKKTSVSLAPQSRIVVSFTKWREPTEAEAAILNNDYEIAPGTMIDMTGDGAGGAHSLLMSFQPNVTPAESEIGQVPTNAHPGGVADPRFGNAGGAPVPPEMTTTHGGPISPEGGAIQPAAAATVDYDDPV